MKYRTLYAKEMEIPNIGGGAPAKTVTSPDADVDNDTDDASSDEVDLFNLLNGTDEDDGSAIFDNIQKNKKPEDDEDEDTEEEPKEEGEPKEEKKPDDKKVQLTEEELMRAEAINKNGTPISAQSAKVIKGLKDLITKKNKEIEEYVKPEYKDKLTKAEETIARASELEAKNKELQDRLDNEFFESSHGFVETFQKPLDDSQKRIERYFKHLSKEEDAADIKNISALFKEAAEYAAKDEEMEFLKIIDQISEDHLEGGPAIKNSFVLDAKRYYDNFLAYTKAHLDKSSERKKMVEERMATSRTGNAVNINKVVTGFSSKFLTEKQGLLDAMDDSMRDKYKATLKTREKTTIDAISKFAATGNLPDELSDIISQGVAFDALAHENTIAWAAFKDATNKVKVIEDELKETKAKLSKYTKNPDRSNNYANTKPAETQRKSKSAIFAAMLENGSTSDD